MSHYGDTMSRLIAALSNLPGVGVKTAQRLAFHIINMPDENVENLSKAIIEAKRNIKYCSTCCTLTDKENAIYVQVPKEIQKP